MENGGMTDRNQQGIVLPLRRVSLLERLLRVFLRTRDEGKDLGGDGRRLRVSSIEPQWSMPTLIRDQISNQCKRS